MDGHLASTFSAFGFGGSLLRWLMAVISILVVACVLGAEALACTRDARKSDGGRNQCALGRASAASPRQKTSLPQLRRAATQLRPVAMLCLVSVAGAVNEVSASTVGEFTAAIADGSINKILLAAGTYELTSDMCAGSAVCINRTLTIEAMVPGAAVLNAMNGRRVFEIQSGGTAALIGLNITGGYASYSVQSVCLLNLLP